MSRQVSQVNSRSRRPPAVPPFGSEPAAAQVMSRFRVLQFNMQFGQMWDDTYPDRAPIRLEATLAEIRQHEADIVFLQEVEQAMPGGVQFQPPPNYTRLREELGGYDSWFAYPKPD